MKHQDKTARVAKEGLELFQIPDWREAFSPRALELGLNLQRAGRVLEWSRIANGRGLVARVKDFTGEVRDVRVVWDANESGDVLVDGDCTCDEIFNCQHVVAAIAAAKPALEANTHASPAEASKPKLSANLKGWLDQLQQAVLPPEAAKPESEPADPPEQIAFVLNVDKQGHGARGELQSQLTVTLYVVSRLAGGGYGNGRSIYFEHLTNYGAPAYARRVDVDLARRLSFIQPMRGGFFVGGNGRVLSGPEAPALLEAILRTGRCHWRGTGRKHPALAISQPRLATLGWVSDKTGMQTPALQVDPPATVILPLAPPWYLDEKTGACGPLDTGLPPSVAEAWLRAPTVTPDQAELLGEELTRRYPELHIPAPTRIEVESVTDLKPRPLLRLYSITTPLPKYGYGYFGRSSAGGREDLNLAQVEFDYAGQRVQPGAPGPWIEQFQDGKLRRIRRDNQAEMLHYSELVKSGFEEARDLFYEFRLGKQDATALALEEPQAWFDFCLNVVPRLKAAGWQVTMEDSFKFRLAEPQEWYLDTEPGSGIDWFGVELGVQLDGKKVNLLPLLLDFFQTNPRALSQEGLAELKDNHVVPITLRDGRILPFPGPRLREILGVLLELFNPQALDRKGRLQLPKLRAAELSALDGAGKWRWLGAAELRDLSRKLHDFQGIKPAPPSPNLRATLRGYQQEGLNWLQFLREYSLGGILADDMGLGKTVQALAHLLHEKESGRADCPSLVIAPTSLMTNWRQEAERFAPALKLLVLHGLDRKQHFDKLQDYDLIVTSYPLLPRDQEVLVKQQFHCVVLDEAQAIKNPKTQYAQIVCQLKARHPLCLTGTPMENHLGELWSLFNFLLPGFLGDEVRFRKVFRNPIEKGREDDRRKLLARRVAPFLLRRRKEEVVKELPPKTEIVQNVELAKQQRDLYETIRLAMHARVREEVAKKGVSRSHIIILDALLKLRQACCDPRLLKFDAAKKVTGSAKLELLMDLLPEMISEGRRILLFSQFTSMLALIEQELAKAKIDYVLLTGQTTDRATPIRRFQDGEVPLFLISLKAGGTGLNLTAADTVIHYDPWWNPAVENQATDRAHRIGQDKSVFVYKLMTIGTVEEKILELQKRKRELVEGLLNEDRKDSLKLSQEDLDVLFAPVG